MMMGIMVMDGDSSVDGEGLARRDLKPRLL